MTFVAQPEAPPLRQDSSGAVRVGSSQVLLEIAIRAFQDGATPETIVQRYPTAALSDVYAVISYYLRHRAEIDTYLNEREVAAAESARLFEGKQRELSEIRSRLAARRGS